MAGSHGVSDTDAQVVPVGAVANGPEPNVRHVVLNAHSLLFVESTNNVYVPAASTCPTQSINASPAGERQGMEGSPRTHNCVTMAS